MQRTAYAHSRLPKTSVPFSDQFHYVKNFNRSFLAQHLKKTVTR